METLTYCVLLERGNSVPLAQISKVVADVSGITVYDATHHVAGCQGFLFEECTLEAAQKLVDGLKAVNVGARILKQEEVVRIPEAVEIKKAVIEDRGLTYFVKEGENQYTAEWKDIALLSTGVVNEQIVTAHEEMKGPSAGEQAARIGLMAVGLPVGFGKKKKVAVERKEANLYFYLDVFLLNPNSRIRITPGTFNFDCLKEQKTYSSTTNFRLLLLELCRRSASALQNQGTEFLAQGKPLNLLHYDSPADVDKESQWLLSLRGV